VAALQLGESGDGPEFGPGGEDREGLLQEESSQAASFLAKEFPVPCSRLGGGLEKD
jgi:hypothetical protein